MISPATLSETMNGLRHLRLRTATLVGERLRLSPKQIRSIQEEIRSCRSYKGKRRELKAERIFLDSELHHDLLEWRNMAIAHLALLKKARCCPKWIAKRLAISAETAEASLRIMLEKKYVAEVDGELVRGTAPIGPFGIPVATPMLRKYQRSMILKSADAVSTLSSDKQLSLIRMIALDHEDLEQFRRMIWEFYESVQAKAAKRDASDLHCLSIHFFPVTTPAE